MTKEDVINLMRSSKNGLDWNANCDVVKKAHSGGYPDYWFFEVVLSGLCDEVLGNGASDLKITIG